MYEIIQLACGKHLFLDVSSFCTGYTITKLENKKCTILESGAIWCPRNFENVDYYRMLYLFILENMPKNKISNVVAEEFFQGAMKGWGTSVVPKTLGVIELACRMSEPRIKFHTIPVSSWRSKLGIKKDITLKGNQWKLPVKNKVESILDYKLPEKIIDLNTKRMRNMPSDLWESIAICLAYLGSEPNNITEFDLEVGFIKQSC